MNVLVWKCRIQYVGKTREKERERENIQSLREHTFESRHDGLTSPPIHLHHQILGFIAHVVVLLGLEQVG